MKKLLAAWLIVLAMLFPAAAQTVFPAPNGSFVLQSGNDSVKDYVTGLPTVIQPLNSTDELLLIQNNSAKSAPVSAIAAANISVLAITRSQIPVSVLGGTTVQLAGYRTINDLGFGAVYTSIGATSTGLMAVQDKHGTWWNMVLSGTVNVGWFGAYADDGAHTITSGDIAANPQWRGTYTAGTTWDTVAVQESKYAAYASASTPGSIVWNGDISPLNIEWFLPGGVYGINKQIVSMQSGFRDRGDGKGTAQLNWLGTPGTIMWLCNSCSYGQEINLTVTEGTAPSYPNLAPLVSLDHTGSISGLETQQVTFYDTVCLAGINSECVEISRSGNGAQGDTVTFVNPIFAGFMSDFAIALGGTNALELVIVNGDCQGFQHDCVRNNGGNVYTYGTHFENENLNFSSFTPVLNQITTHGADVHALSGTSAAASLVDAARAEDTILTASDGGAGIVDVRNATVLSADIVGAYFTSFAYLPGIGLYSSNNNTKGRAFFVVDDGGNGTWSAVTSTAGLVLTDSAASYTINQWIGYQLHWRFGSNGNTFHCLITANTATTVTVAGGCNGGSLPTPTATSLYHIGGVSSGSEPNWDAGSSGHSVSGGAFQGFYTTASSTSVAIGTTDFAKINVNDYVMIPQADQIAPASGQAVAMPLYAKVTAKSGSPCSGFAFGDCLTVNKAAAFATGNTVSGSGAFGYYGTPLSDNNLKWVEIPFDVVQASNTISDLSGRGLVGAPMGAITQFNPRRPDWIDATNYNTTQPPGIGNQVSFDANARIGALCAAINDSSTPVDLTTSLLACNNIPYTPTQNATLNAPVPLVQGAQEFNLLITTSGVSSFTITFGSNFSANGTLATGTSSGALFTIHFIADGKQWREAWRAPNELIAGSSATSGFTAGQILYSDGAHLQASPATTDSTGDLTLPNNANFNMTGNNGQIRVGSSGSFNVQNGWNIADSFGYGWSANGLGTEDAGLYRQGATGIVGLVVPNSPTTPTSLQIYNTADQVGATPTNFERAAFDWIISPNTATLGTQNGGTGLGRSLAIVTSNTVALTINPSQNVTLANTATIPNLVLTATPVMAASTTGAGTQTFTNSPCSGLTSERWIGVRITGQAGNWFIPACQ